MRTLKPLLFIICSLLITSCRSGEVPKKIIAANKWERTIVRFEKQDQLTPPQKGCVLFVGSSSFRMWKTLEKDMAPTKVLNRGFGGSKLVDLLVFKDRIVTNYHPSKIFLYEGDNDLSNGKKPIKEFLKEFVEFHNHIHKKLPDTKIYFVSIKPSLKRIKVWPYSSKGNAAIANECSKHPYLHYVDVASAMFDSNKKLKDIFVKDNLHMNAKGYKIWAAIIRPLCR
jgi:lysophospholipase L1-like esterase